MADRRVGAHVRSALSCSPTGKRVAESMHGPDESRLACSVAERLPDFGDQARQIGFRHEGRRPQVLMQLVLRQGPRTLVDQRLEELERLGRQMDLLAAAQELPRVGVERQIAKPESHCPHENPEKPYDFPNTRGQRGSIIAPSRAGQSLPEGNRR